MAWDIINADCTAWLPEQAGYGLRADCVICDPPYHLASIAKRFGGMKAGATGVVADRMRNRSDGAARLARGFMGSPTDAGDVAFQPETWKAIASVLKPGARLAAFGGTRTWWKLAAAIDAAGFEIEDTIIWAYGQGLVLRRSRLKPALEPIILARMPGPVLDLNIDDCRVPTDPKIDDPRLSGAGSWTTDKSMKQVYMDGLEGKHIGSSLLGRWPANLIHDGSSEVLACFPDSPGQLADARADGSPKNNKIYGKMRHRQGEASADKRYTDSGSTNFAARPGERRFDSGSAARFFNTCEFTEAERSIIYAAKATQAERMSYCILCGEHFRSDQREAHGHGAEDQEHIKAHPTIKPQSVLSHLVKLLSRPGDLVLDPFCGSGSTVEAAHRLGRHALGIELDTRHAESSRARMRSLAPD